MAKYPYRVGMSSRCEGASQRAPAASGRRAQLVVLGLLAGGLVFPLGIGHPRSVSPLDLPLLPTEPRESVPLQEALSTLGHSPREGFVLFGLEEQLTDGKEPTVNVNIRPDTTMGAALGEILAQLPPYEMEVVSDHLIDLHPKGAKEDPNNILNVQVQSFDAVSKHAYGILEAPQDFIPELKQALRPKPEPGKQLIELYFGGYHGGPLITLHLKDVTIRDILNAASVATEPSFEDHKPEAPRGWVCVFNPSPPRGNSKYSFRTLFAMPSYWHYGVRDTQEPSKP